MTPIRTAGLQVVHLTGASPSALETAVAAWLETKQSSERIMDIQYLFAQPEGDDESYVAMILYTTQ